MRKILLLAITLFYLGNTHAQDKDVSWRRKLSPLLAQKSPDNQEQTYWVVASDPIRLKNWLKTKQLDHAITGEYAGTGLLVVKISRRLLDSLLLPSPLVLFADQPRIPREEQVINGFDNSTNMVNTAHRRYPAINGDGLTVSIKENRPDTADIDFRGRYLSTSLSDGNLSAHATIMTTMIGGAGNSHYTGKGAAWATRLSSSGFSTLLPDPDAAYQQYGISVQNHSYGTGIENYYGADAAAYDASAIANPSLVHVFSAGNSGDKTSPSGSYSGIPLFANLTGSFKMAKNIITVGLVDSFYRLEPLSSRGPAYDGRVKPELVAFGEDGSSGAAAIVSGIALLMQHAYKTGNLGQLPASCLVRAILVNSADPIAGEGPDFRSGYGNANALHALRTVKEGRFFMANTQPRTDKDFIITIPAGIQRVKVTLCWTDPPALANAPKALVNDLDLELISNSLHQSWQPWVLSRFPHADSLSKPAVRKRDTLNTLEQVTLKDPVPGEYIIRVHGTDIKSGSQFFAVAYQLDSIDRFEWYYPTANDNLAPGENNVLRWASGPDATPATLSASVDGGKTWKEIVTGLNTGQGYFKWNAPDTNVQAMLRMTVGQQTFLTDTFTISRRLLINTGFNCADSFLLSWNKAKGIHDYALFELGNEYLEPLLTTSDTSIVLYKSHEPALYYAVASVVPADKRGVKSFAFDYTAQGTGCYIRNFLASLENNNSAQISIDLGSLYQVRQLVIEKRVANGYGQLQKISPAGLSYSITDAALQKGLNIYRLRIDLQNGSSIYSQPETVYYFNGSRYIVFPNPVHSAGGLTVLSSDPQPGLLQLFNASGHLMVQRKIGNLAEQVAVQGLAKGIYFLVITQEGKRIFKTGIVIQ